jgi:hypothetical protein
MRRSNAQRLVFLTLTAALMGPSCGDDNAVPNLPVANAGFNREVLADQEARLDGSASYDPDGRPLTFAWTLVSMPTDSVAKLFDAHTAAPAITPDFGGNYLFSLVVNNGKRDSRPAAVVLVVLGGSQNAAPVATAVCTPADCKVKHGTTVSTTSGSSFRLDGRSSYDPDGDSITYRWTQVTNIANCGPCVAAGVTCDPSVTALATFPNATANETKELADIKAPMAVGIMIFQLDVKDTGDLVGTACLRVESTDNAPLSIVATPASLTVYEGASIALDGDSSGDEDTVDKLPTNLVTYQWTHDPPGVTVVYTPNATSKIVTAVVSGLSADAQVTFTLTASDTFLPSDPCAKNAETCGRFCCGEVVMDVTHTLPDGDACDVNAHCAKGACSCTDSPCTADNKKCASVGCLCQYDSNFDGACDGNLDVGTKPEGCLGTHSCTGGSCI